mgnify:CR=1 FL=1
MSVQYSPELAALADRPDFEVSLPEEPDPGPNGRIRRYAAAAGLFLAITFAIAIVFFVPVLVFNLSRIEALEVAGRQISASAFAEQLRALFWGTFILALAFTSFAASVLLFASGRTIRPRSRSLSREDALTHLAVLRLSGPER